MAVVGDRKRKKQFLVIGHLFFVFSADDVF